MLPEILQTLVLFVFRTNFFYYLIQNRISGLSADDMVASQKTFQARGKGILVLFWRWIFFFWIIVNYEFEFTDDSHTMWHMECFIMQRARCTLYSDSSRSLEGVVHPVCRIIDRIQFRPWAMEILFGWICIEIFEATWFLQRCFGIQHLILAIIFPFWRLEITGYFSKLYNF